MAPLPIKKLEKKIFSRKLVPLNGRNNEILEAPGLQPADGGDT
jgi:hypothetical protein